jgi:catechol 2,3-dioxygenase-like lactoylglutathione lyase family enzyme
MKIRRVVPDISSRCLEESVRFDTDFLGFEVAMDMDWIVTVCSPTNETAQINLLRSTDQIKPPENIAISIELEDVDKLYEAALAAGFNITYPLTTEPWGVRRFFVVDPNGVTINVMTHHG